MRPSPLLRPLAVLLGAGSLLLVGAASVHPVLHGSASDQLAMIGDTGHWRTIHLLLSLGTGLFIVASEPGFSQHPTPFASNMELS